MVNVRANLFCRESRDEDACSLEINIFADTGAGAIRSNAKAERNEKKEKYRKMICVF